MGDKSSVPQGRGSKTGSISNGYRSFIWRKHYSRQTGESGLAASRLEQNEAEKLPESLISLQGRKKPAQAFQTTVKLRDRCGVGDANVIAGTKTLTWNCCDVRFPQKLPSQV